MFKFQYHDNGTLPPNEEWCFVFGSNERGIHGAGSALVAREKYGAVLGNGKGFSPNELSYALPTKNANLLTLSLNKIEVYVKSFIEVTHKYPEKKFWVTAVGCGLAGYSHSQMAVLFKDCNTNCSFPIEWRTYLEEDKCPNILYVGIGSRETPNNVLETMRSLGTRFGILGYTLRSGGAEGADTAFEEGCDKVHGRKEIWIPWTGFQRRDSRYLPGLVHVEVASKLHPIWNKLSRGAQALHARNIGQILGVDLKKPVQFVVCYTSDGVEEASQVSRTTGGTGTAIKLASLNNIPVFNLKNDDGFSRLEDFLELLSKKEN